MTKPSPINDERTPFVENVVPPFKAYAKVMDVLNFVWCERAMSARKFVLFRTVESHLKKADGVGRVPGTEYDLLLIESSESNLTENIQYSMDDTLKQLESTVNTLRQQITTDKSA
ncbi:hypothetical protein DFQ28_008799 [Apophysomyces sp. BC1034]|nr:hypothetical protein DFQ28_008799 [Apophysomyces sp. BC1034]